jgi:hypothetical protein
LPNFVLFSRQKGITAVFAIEVYQIFLRQIGNLQKIIIKNKKTAVARKEKKMHLLYRTQCCRPGMFIPDPDFFHPEFQI